MLFKNIFAEKFGENIGDFDSYYCYLCMQTKVITSFVFKKKCQFFFAENWQTLTPDMKGIKLVTPFDSVENPLMDVTIVLSGGRYG
jgi:hypothetical protein